MTPKQVCHMIGPLFLIIRRVWESVLMIPFRVHEAYSPIVFHLLRRVANLLIILTYTMDCKRQFTVILI